MKKMTTFEDIFNRLASEYIGNQVEIITNQDGVEISNIRTKIRDIEIIPLNKRKNKKWCKSGKKVGLIKIRGNRGIKSSKINIPFLLGFNTMEAYFIKDRVNIKTYNMEFIIRKKGRKRQSA